MNIGTRALRGIVIQHIKNALVLGDAISFSVKAVIKYMSAYANVLRGSVIAVTTRFGDIQHGVMSGSSLDRR